MSDLSNLLLQKRQDLKLTQEEAAEKIGANRSVISRWENGKSIPDKMMSEAICEVLHIKIDDYLTLRESEKLRASAVRPKRLENLCGIWEDWQRSFISKEKIISSRVKIELRNNTLRYLSEFLINGSLFQIVGKCWVSNNCLSIDARDAPNGQNYGERAFMLYDLSTSHKGYVFGQAIGATSMSGFTPVHSHSLLWRPPSGNARLMEISTPRAYSKLDKRTKEVLEETGVRQT